MGAGRLEVKRNGRWGTVCHRGFNLLAANVASKELGFGTAKRELRNSFFGKGCFILLSIYHAKCEAL